MQQGIKGGFGHPQLHARIQQLMRESKDPRFTEYLSNLGNDLWNGKINDHMAAAALEQNLQLYRQNCRQASKKNSEPPKMEIAIGAGLLGVLGALFLLIAFVIFAMNFMSGTVKGICLYAISLVVILIAEIWVCKKQNTFALGMTGVGISSLFIDTLVNHFTFSNFDGTIAIVLIFVTAMLAYILSVKKDSSTIRIVTLLGSMVGMLPIMATADGTDIIILSIMVFIVHCAAALVPVKKQQDIAWLMQMFAEGISVLVFVLLAVYQEVDMRMILFFSTLMLIVLNLLFLKVKIHTGSIFVFAAMYIIHLPLAFWGTSDGAWGYLFYLFPLLLITIVFAFVGKDKYCRWIPYWFFNLAVLGFCVGSVFAKYRMKNWEELLCILLLFGTAKLLFRVKELEISNCIISVGTLLYLGTMPAYSREITDILCVLVMLTAFLISTVTLHTRKSFHEVIITLACVAVIQKLVPSDLELPMISAVLFFGILLFNQIKGWKDDKVLVYNIINLSMIALTYVRLAFIDDIWIYSIMFLFGIAVIVVCFEPDYRISNKNKFLWLGIYLTYMILILNTEDSIVKSILLAFIALACVGTGFYFRQAGARIFGLILAVLVALKVVLFDFSGVQVMQRMIVFLTVGILILVISYIYIRLEKHIDKEEIRES